MKKIPESYYLLNMTNIIIEVVSIILLLTFGRTTSYNNLAPMWVCIGVFWIVIIAHIVYAIYIVLHPEEKLDLNQIEKTERNKVVIIMMTGIVLIIIWTILFFTQLLPRLY